MKNSDQRWRFRFGFLGPSDFLRPSSWRRALGETSLSCLRWSCDDRGAKLLFQMGDQTGTIFFDGRRHELFYQGHHVKNSELSPEQWLALKMFCQCLDESSSNSNLARYYRRSLQEDFFGELRL